MDSTMHALVEAKQLLQWFTEGTPPLLIDARAGEQARHGYEDLHLEGALHVDLEKELSDIRDHPSKGGRHPLPGYKEFSTLLGRLGIDPQTHVVVYDDQFGANAAARFWWMMRSLGHQQVQVLNGGLITAIQAGVPLSDGQESLPAEKNYPASPWSLPIATLDQVEHALKDKNQLVIDVRAEERYLGIHEPIDTIAGHMPGAINHPFSKNLDQDGRFLPPESLRNIYSQLLDGRPASRAIFHCGSGVTACHSLLAMDHAGMGIPALYPGSWSEWSHNGQPIA